MATRGSPRRGRPWQGRPSARAEQCGVWPVTLVTSDAGARGTLIVALQSILQVPAIYGHLFPCLRANDERHEQLADPVPLEIELDRDPRPCVLLDRLDGVLYGLPDRAAGAAGAPACGGLSSVISEVVVVRTAPAIRRVV